MSLRPALRRRLAAVGVVAVVAVSGVGYWGLDRYVIDHVAISDVAAYESAMAPLPAPAAAEASPAAQGPFVTDTTYLDGETSIEISTVVTGAGSNRVTYYVADVYVGDGTQLRGGFAENKFGRNIVKGTSDIAESYDAIFAVNGDYYGFRDNGILIRNGVLLPGQRRPRGAGDLPERDDGGLRRADHRRCGPAGRRRLEHHVLRPGPRERRRGAKGHRPG